MIKRFFYLLLTPILLIACDVSKKRNREVVATGNAWYEKNYRYADGNANEYVFSKNSFEYFPVKPAQSSSGTYDGGTYIKKLPDLKGFFALADLVKSAYETKADHIMKREMGSGAIEIWEGGNKMAFIVKPGSASQQKIEAALKKLKEAR